MAVALTIFTIITGTASLLGFLYIFFEKSQEFKKLSSICFLLALIWSAYVLIYPSSAVQNVSKKFALYEAPSVEERNSKLLVLRGKVKIWGTEPVSVAIPYPFEDHPEVEVLNTNGHDVDFVPSIQKITPHQVVFRSSTSGGSYNWRNYGWVARGVPLNEIQQ